MSKNKKGMRKEWHTKRIDYSHEAVIDFLEMMRSYFCLEEVLNSEELKCFYLLYNTLYDYRNGLEVDNTCGSYMVEYGYNWISASDEENK